MASKIGFKYEVIPEVCSSTFLGVNKGIGEGELFSSPPQKEEGLLDFILRCFVILPFLESVSSSLSDDLGESGLRDGLVENLKGEAEFVVATKGANLSREGDLT